MTKFPVTYTTTPKEKPAPGTALGFGNYFTDHMFLMDYTEGQGWHDGRIVPYAPIPLDPAAGILHYGQGMFEGLKAYKNAAGEVQLFRPYMNAKRTNNTNDRLCIPRIDEDLFVDAIKQLVAVEEEWIPTGEGESLYLRPFIFANEAFLGVRPSNTYLFVIIAGPAGSYYAGGMHPNRLHVEDTYVRACAGGTGEAKCGGNYAASLKAQVVAMEEGYDQILWLDGVEKKYVEEIGTSNAFFKINGEVITAPLVGTILPGITRDSVIQVLKDKGIPVSERKLAIAEVFEAAKAGLLEEMFASGTAAVISPVGELNYKGETIVINNNEIGPVAQDLYDTIYGIQRGRVADKYGWITPIDVKEYK